MMNYELKNTWNLLREPLCSSCFGGGKFGTEIDSRSLVPKESMRTIMNYDFNFDILESLIAIRKSVFKTLSKLVGGSDFYIDNLIVTNIDKF